MEKPSSLRILGEMTDDPTIFSRLPCIPPTIRPEKDGFFSILPNQHIRQNAFCCFFEAGDSNPQRRPIVRFSPLHPYLQASIPVNAKPEDFPSQPIDQSKLMKSYKATKSGAALEDVFGLIYYIVKNSPSKLNRFAVTLALICEKLKSMRTIPLQPLILALRAKNDLSMDSVFYDGESLYLAFQWGKTLPGDKGSYNGFLLPTLIRFLYQLAKTASVYLGDHSTRWNQESETGAALSNIAKQIGGILEFDRYSRSHNAQSVFTDEARRLNHYPLWTLAERGNPKKIDANFHLFDSETLKDLTISPKEDLFAYMYQMSGPQGGFLVRADRPVLTKKTEKTNFWVEIEGKKETICTSTKINELAIMTTSKSSGPLSFIPIDPIPDVCSYTVSIPKAGTRDYTKFTVERAPNNYTDKPYEVYNTKTGEPFSMVGFSISGEEQWEENQATAEYDLTLGLWKNFEYLLKVNVRKGDSVETLTLRGTSDPDLSIFSKRQNSFTRPAWSLSGEAFGIPFTIVVFLALKTILEMSENASKILEEKFGSDAYNAKYDPTKFSIGPLMVQKGKRGQESKLVTISSLYRESIIDKQ